MNPPGLCDHYLMLVEIGLDSVRVPMEKLRVRSLEASVDVH